MTFSEPRLVWALLAVPIAVAIQWVAMARGEERLTALTGPRSPHPLLAQRRPGDRRIGAVLATLALVALVLGAAGPEWGRELTRRQGTGSDVLFLLDTSASMDARDVSPSRMAEAKREALALLDRLEGSRVGAVAFAGDAVRLTPLTQDLSAVRLTLEGLSTQSVSEPGTDLGRGLRMAMKVLPKGRREEQVVILWTDGEDLEGGARAAIDDLVSAGIRVFAVGVGTPTGDVVPQLDEDGRVTDIKRDENGTAVRSKLDENLLRTLARRTHGGYFAASRPGGELPRLLAALSGVERSSRASRLVERRVARFPLFAAAAALLLGFALVRPRRVVGVAAQEVALARERERAAKRRARAQPRESAKPSSPKDRPRRGNSHPTGPAGVRPGARPSTSGRPPARIAALLAVAGGLGLLAPDARAQSDWARGNAAFKKGEYVDAESLYAKRARKSKSTPPALQVNRATARALAGDRDGATRDLERLTDAAGHAGRDARYNLGTVLGEKHELDEALARLREALVHDPSDQDARWNYEVLLAQKRREQQQKEKKPEPQKGQPPPQPQQSQPQSSPSQNSPGQPPPSAGNTPQQQTPQSGQQGMTRDQAQQLLGALDEMQRAENQRQHKVRVLRDRHGKDW